HAGHALHARPQRLGAHDAPGERSSPRVGERGGCADTPHPRRRVDAAGGIGDLPEVEDQIVGHVGAFEKVVQTLKTLVGRGFSPHVSIVVTKENVEGIEETIAFLHGLGIRGLSLLHTQDSGTARLSREKSVDFETYRQACYRGVKQADSCDMTLSATTNYPFLLFPGLKFGSRIGLSEMMYGHPDGRRIMYVTGSGSVLGTLYQNLSNPIVAGNILTDDLTELWNSSPVFESIRRRKANSRCLDCEHYEYCRGGPPYPLENASPSAPRCPLYEPLLVNE
nr:SPASM domain-containing protein [Nitrososphaerota archaeon]